jgi:hypothetical protein
MPCTRPLIVALALLASAIPASAQLAIKGPLLLEENFQRHLRIYAARPNPAWPPKPSPAAAKKTE